MAHRGAARSLTLDGIFEEEEEEEEEASPPQARTRKGGGRRGSQEHKHTDPGCIQTQAEVATRRSMKEGKELARLEFSLAPPHPSFELYDWNLPFGASCALCCVEDLVP